MRKRSLVVLVSILAMTFMLLAPGVAAADNAAGGPYYLAVFGQERFVRGGEVLQPEDFGENFRPRPGDQIFFNEALYHSGPGGAKGTRAGRTTITCLVGIGMTAFCNGTMHLRGQGEVYLTTTTAQQERFLAAIIGGTGDFKAARGDVVLKNLSNNRTLYRMRLR